MKKNLLNFSRERDPEGQTSFAYGARRERERERESNSRSPVFISQSLFIF